MIRIFASQNGERAKEYFLTGLAREDYYAGETRLGLWFGSGAERLGLKGEVSRDDFARLCGNRHPGTGQRLTPRMKANRRVAFDINFHVPKSVSVLYGLGHDDRILTVFHEAVRYAMAGIEESAFTRVRIAGADTDRKTGNLVWAEFTHFTARPVGGIADPHLHAHCYVFNATFDEVEKRWKAAQLGEIKHHVPFHEARYLERLAEKLRGLGYEIVPSGKYWEIEGVPASLIEKFSTRTKQINRVVEERGIVNPEEKAGVGAKTREAKNSGESFESTRANWEERTSADEQDKLHQARSSKPRGKVSGVAKDAVKFAIEQSFERSAVVPDKLFMSHALSRAYGKASEGDIRAEMTRTGMIQKMIDGKEFVTTKEVFAEESRMIELASKGRGRYQRLIPMRKGNPKLNNQQTAAVQHALESQDFVTAIVGKSGTGKTTLLSELQKQLKAANLPVSQKYLSPTTKGRDRLTEEGFGDASTVAGLLTNSKSQGMQNAGIVIVDEAGLLGTKQMLSLMEYCWKAGHRLVLVGDPRQNISQSRGSPMRSLMDHGGVGSARVDEIVRQSGPLKEAVKAISEGRMEDGLKRLDQMGSIHETDKDEAAGLAALDYVGSRNQGLRTIFITPSKYEREAAERSLRPLLKADKTLGKATLMEQLVPKEMTEAAKARHSSYEVGDIVEFHQNTKRGWFMPKGSHFAAGTRWEVVGHGITGNAKIQRIRSLDPFGKVKVKEPYQVQHLPVANADRFSVYTKREIEIAAGERIRITKNGRTHSAFEYIARSAINWATSPKRKLDNLPKRKLVNGNEHVVKRRIRGGHLLLDNGLIVPKDFGHIEYGYCTSAVKAQGANVDRGIVLHTVRSGRAGHCRQTYVSVSRGASSVMVYTDSKANLLDAARTEAKDWNAMDLVARKEPPNLVQHGYEAETARRQAERERQQRERQDREARQRDKRGRDRD